VSHAPTIASPQVVDHDAIAAARLLLGRLDALAAVLEERRDVIALLGLGSVGVALERLDEHSDLDFFVIVDDDARQRYLDEIGWLEAVAPVAYSFRNTTDGRKLLWADGVWAEYAVFTLEGLRAGSTAGSRVVWRRPDAPEGLEHAGLPAPSSHETPEHQVGEALTNLYVGLHRDLRGERLAATRLIQVHAIDRLLTFLDLRGEASAPRQDPFAVERGAERRLAEQLPLAEMAAGYERNAGAALAILDWLEARPDVEVDASLATSIRALARRAGG
jgi:hypothetical protein